MLLLTDDETLFGAATALKPSGFTIATITAFDGAAAQICESGAGPSRLAHPPVSCLGLVIFGPHAPWLDALRDWWRDNGGVDLPVLTLSETLTAETRDKLLAEWLTVRLGELLETLCAENRSLLTQNRELRRAYDALQSTFAELEQFVVDNELQTPVLHHEADPVAYWTPSEANGVIEQKLPILSTQLSFFELFFRKPASSASAPIHVTMRLEPGGRLHEEWTLAANEIAEGWNAFRPAPMVGASEEIIVELRVPAGKDAPAVGLTAPHANAPHGATADKGQWRSLAMRIWRGPAGVAPPAPPAVAQTGDAQLTSLAPIELLRASEHDFSGRLKKGAPAAVQEKEGRLLLHPFGMLPSIAMLPNPLPAGVTHVSVEGRTLEERASPIAYAIAIVAGNVAPEKIFLRGMRPANGFSGWRILPPKQPQRILLTLERPTCGGEHLYLATRLPSGSTESWAWATWRDVKIGMNWRPETAPAKIDGAGAIERREIDPAPIVWRGDWLAHVPWLAKPVSATRFLVADATDLFRSLVSRLMRRRRQ